MPSVLGDSKFHSYLISDLYQMLVVIETDYWSHDVLNKFSSAYVHIFITDILYCLFFFFLARNSLPQILIYVIILIWLYTTHFFTGVQKQYITWPKSHSVTYLVTGWGLNFSLLSPKPMLIEHKRKHSQC